MYRDKQLVRITVFVLLVGIVLVYAVFFNVHGDTLISDASGAIHNLTSGEENSTSLSGSAQTGTAQVQMEEETTGTTMGFSGLEALFGSDQEYLGTGIKILSGSTIFQGSIDILRTIGVDYEYVLKDGKYNIYYVYIGRDKTYNLPSIAAEFGWKTVEIKSQKDIVNNLYFGDRVTFVELPQYKDVKVNVFIQYGRDLWMIQDDASQYRAHKKYIRQLFTGK